MPHLQIPAALSALATTKKRYKIIYGGRGSAKSQTVARLCLMDSQVNSIKIACFREFQNSILDSVHSLLKSQIEDMELKGFTPTASAITNVEGGEFTFRGLARNIESIKSMHGYNRFWVEEGQFLSWESIKLLTPTIREDDSEIWITANPNSSADPFSVKFLNPFIHELDEHGFYEDDEHLIIKVNYNDNPWFPEVLEKERRLCKKRDPPAEYEHIWEGAFNDTVANAIIKTEWFDAAIDAHIKLGFKPLGALMASHDPSDKGPDSKGYCLRHGSVVLDVQENKEGEVNEGCDWALDLAIAKQADYFVWDGGGMGAALRKQIDDKLKGKKMEVFMFTGQETPDDPDVEYEPMEVEEKSKRRNNKNTFTNKRAQYAWRLRDRFFKTYLAVKKGQYIDPAELISISSDIECMKTLRSEVCRIPKKTNSNNMIQIMTKEEMLRVHKIQSPNLFDSLMMSMYSPQAIVEKVRISSATGF